MRALAQAHRKAFAETFHACNTGERVFEPRAPRSTAAGSATRRCATWRRSKIRAGRRASTSVFERADNMTEREAAFSLLADAKGPEREQALASFYASWRQDPLMLDKWFAVQALSSLPDTPQRVRALYAHSDFSLANPNRVRALVGSFAAGNPLHFHAADGSGYRFLGDVVLELDPRNPQVASRMASQFAQWRRFEPGRRAQDAGRAPAHRRTAFALEGRRRERGADAQRAEALSRPIRVPRRSVVPGGRASSSSAPGRRDEHERGAELEAAPFLSLGEARTVGSVATLHDGAARLRGEVVEVDAHLADQRRADRGDAERLPLAPGQRQVRTQALVLGEDAGHPLDADAVHGPEPAGEIDGAQHARVAGRVEAVVVARRQVERGEAAALVAARVRVRAEQRGERVGPSLQLEQRATLDPARLAPGAVAGRDQRVGRGVDRAYAFHERAREEVLERGVGVDRLARLAEIGADRRREDRGSRRVGASPADAGPRASRPRARARGVAARAARASAKRSARERGTRER